MRILRFAAAICAAGWMLATAHAQTLLPRPNLDIVEQANIRAMARQPDGGVIVAGDFTTIGGVPRAGLARFAPDGTLDPIWNPPVGRVDELATGTDGDVYAAVWVDGIDESTRHRLMRLDGAGTGAPVGTWDVLTQGYVSTIAVDGDDVFVGGRFTTVGGQARARLAKLSAQTGAVDPAWAPALDGSPLAIVVAGQLVYVGGVFSTINGAAHRNFARFARGGAGVLDTSWNASPDRGVSAMATDGAGTLYFSRGFATAPGAELRRLSLATGQVDATWHPSLNDGARVLAIGGGALYAGGGFVTVEGAAHPGVARFDLATGALDTAWTASSPRVAGIAVSADGGRVLVGGPGRANALPQPALIAFDAAGAPREPVNAMKPSEVNAFARMRDGGLMIGGRFAQIDGQPRMHLARLKADGTLDAAWRADTDYEVFRLAANAAGEIYVGGSFLKVAGQMRNAAAKFSPDGVLDVQWNPAPTDDSDPLVFAFAFGADGSVYAGGEFDQIGGQVRNGVAKLDNVTGAADPAWNANLTGMVTWVDDLQLDGEGRLYIAGHYDAIGGQAFKHLARVAANGTGAVDAGWNPDARDVISKIGLRGRSLYTYGRFPAGVQDRWGMVKIPTGGSGAYDATWSPAVGSSRFSLDGAGNLVVLAYIPDPPPATTWRQAVRRILRNGTVDAGWAPDFDDRGQFSGLYLDRDVIYIGAETLSLGGERRTGAAAFDNDVIFGDGLDP